MMETQIGSLASWMHINQAEMKANQAKTGTNLREMRADRELLKEEMLAKMEANQKRWMLRDAHHERMMARMDSQLEKMEAMNLEASPEEILSKM
jgi:hypothetical protein